MRVTELIEIWEREFDEEVRTNAEFKRFLEEDLEGYLEGDSKYKTFGPKRQLFWWSNM